MHAPLLLLVLLATGCTDTAMDARLRRLEERLSALETSGRPVGEEAVAAGAADVRSLEARLAAVERRLAAAGASAGPGATVAPGDAAGAAERRVEQRRERRGQLRELTEEYRARLAAIRLEETDPAARQAAVREALTWYREQRRAILAGTAGAGTE